jgi:diaminohydroxyphosphoribosylaminopyrimidine deaminase/5-amino-6-(5-phosphoribosylamino)uracil reductase
VEVEVGVLAAEAEALLRSYLHWCRTGLPYVVVKLATSLDGRVGFPGRRYQLSSEASVELVHRLRAELGAVAVGAGTALVDDPLLTVRLPSFEGPPALRVLVDAKGRVPGEARLFGPEAPTLVATTEAGLGRKGEWEKRGARVLLLPGSPRGLDLRALLEALGREGVQGLLVEGGPDLATSFLEEGLAQEVLLILAPRVLGPEALPLAPRPWPGLRLVQAEVVGEDLWVRLAPE